MNAALNKMKHSSLFVSAVFFLITMFVGVCSWGLVKVYDIPSTYVTRAEYVASIQQLSKSIDRLSKVSNKFLSVDEFNNFRENNNCNINNLRTDIKGVHSEVVELNRFLRNKYSRE